MSWLVPRAPDKHLKQYGSEGNSLLREAVVCTSAVIGSGFMNENAASLELLQSIRQDVGGNAFTGALELAKGAVATHHHVPHDKERPTITKEIEGDADGTSRAAFRTGTASHEKIVAI
jgi:hypothetical protein